jgi:hypothetical protein
LRLQAAGAQGQRCITSKEINHVQQDHHRRAGHRVRRPALTTKVSARLGAKAAQTSQGTYYLERASQNHDNGGN